jgi:hypothetical protein
MCTDRLGSPSSRSHSPARRPLRSSIAGGRDAGSRYANRLRHRRGDFSGPTIPANRCIFGHVRHNWPGATLRNGTVTAKDTKYGFGRLIDLAHTKPVAVAKHGLPDVVVMPCGIVVLCKTVPVTGRCRDHHSVSSSNGNDRRPGKKTDRGLKEGRRAW